MKHSAMRNGQNKRMRGRNRSKGQNPLTRVYESNGPDVKIRGTANHVAEKYVQLARDAQSSGDPVAAENYYQHAEHYFRLIAAVQEQFRQNNPYARDGEGRDGYDDGDEDGGDVDRLPAFVTGGGPQSAAAPAPYGGNGHDGGGGPDRFPLHRRRRRRHGGPRDNQAGGEPGDPPAGGPRTNGE
jgi:hypothetical protein